MNRLRRRTELAGAQRGMSLAELLVSMMVFSLLSVLVVSLFATVSRSFTQDRALTDSTTVASAAMNEVTRVVRSGTEIETATVLPSPVFLVATRESVVLRSFAGADSATLQPVVVRFEVSTGRALVESTWRANAASGPKWTFAGLPAAPYLASSGYWTGAATTRTIARGITPLVLTPTPSVPTFRYCDEGGDELVPVGNASLNAAQMALVASVAVRLSVQTDVTERADPVVLLNQIGIPNLPFDRTDFC